MPQIAAFVDAGYLYAQGSKLLTREKASRESTRLSVQKVLDQLTELARSVASDCRLLRIYWYDGLLRSNSPSMEQDQIGQSRNVELRLVLVNSSGVQKGVDSLIVTDLIELARNRAITDALILSGDEDIKIGVQVAQTFGVRIHLLGIKPARGSQSLSLMMEADTCHEWDETVIGGWMDCVDDAPDSSLEPPMAVRALDSTTAVEAPSTRDEFLAIVDIAVKKRIETLTAPELDGHVQYLDAHRNRIHWEVDRPTLGSLRNSLDRNLTETERSDYREAFAAALRAAQARSLAENGRKPRE